MTLVHEKNKICIFSQIFGYFTTNPIWDLEKFQKNQNFQLFIFSLKCLGNDFGR